MKAVKGERADGCDGNQGDLKSCGNRWIFCRTDKLDSLESGEGGEERCGGFEERGLDVEPDRRDGRSKPALVRDYRLKEPVQLADVDRVSD